MEALDEGMDEAISRQWRLGGQGGNHSKRCS